VAVGGELAGDKLLERRERRSREKMGVKSENKERWLKGERNTQEWREGGN
jgi:hypothetical protein